MIMVISPNKRHLEELARAQAREPSAVELPQSGAGLAEPVPSRSRAEPAPNPSRRPSPSRSPRQRTDEG